MNELQSEELKMHFKFSQFICSPAEVFHGIIVVSLTCTFIFSWQLHYVIVNHLMLRKFGMSSVAYVLQNNTSLNQASGISPYFCPNQTSKNQTSYIVVSVSKILFKKFVYLFRSGLLQRADNTKSNRGCICKPPFTFG